VATSSDLQTSVYVALFNINDRFDFPHKMNGFGRSGNAEGKVPLAARISHQSRVGESTG
jgi:hypothetical protein